MCLAKPLLVFKSQGKWGQGRNEFQTITVANKELRELMKIDENCVNCHSNTPTKPFVSFVSGAVLCLPQRPLGKSHSRTTGGVSQSADAPKSKASLGAGSGKVSVGERREVVGKSQKHSYSTVMSCYV